MNTRTIEIPDYIPEYMRGALHRYINQGILPGSFLRAVLENNLKEACGRADSTNQKLLLEYVHFLYNDAPSACWGSPEKVSAWVNTKAKEEGSIDG